MALDSILYYAKIDLYRSPSRVVCIYSMVQIIIALNKVTKCLTWKIFQDSMSNFSFHVILSKLKPRLTNKAEIFQLKLEIHVVLY